jgi:uncharacterized repeat protein (TIGR02543 family)
MKNVTITPFSKPERLPIVTTITIQGASQNVPPQWSVDTLRKTIKVGTPLFQALSEICSDANNEKITYTLLPGEPDNDIIVETTYQFNPTIQNVGTFIAQVKASDAAGSFSILPVKITVDNGSEDKQAPEITFIAPTDTNATVAVDSFTIDLLCTDASGVASVSAALGTTTFPSNLKNGHYLIPVKGFTKGTTNVVTITAKDSSALVNTNTRKLYFNYSTSTPPFTVTYNGNTNTAGAPPADPGKYEIGATVSVKDNTGNMVKVGYTFVGWNTAADGNGTAYASGVTFPMGTANVTLYAQWTTKPTFTVTYNGNANTGGTVPIDGNKYVTAATVTIRDNTGLLVKAGASFAGWNTAADGNGTTYAGGGSLLMGSANVILYAKWTTKPTYSVTFNSNGGSGTMADLPIESGTSMSLTANTFTKSGSVFFGWATTATGTTVEYADKARYTMGESNVTLYAIWSQNAAYKITFNSNGGTGTLADQSIVSGLSAPLTANTFTKSGSVFAGWASTATGITVEYADKASYTMGGSDLTLYAIWSQNAAYKVTFNSNGGTGTMTDQSIVTGMSAPLTANAFTKSGSVFAGWTTTATGTTVEYADKVSYTMGGSNVTLYAIWSQNAAYKVTFNSNGGTGTMADQSVVQGLSAPLTANAFTKTGSVFAGWASTATGTTVEYADKASYTMGGSNVILYAIWSQNPAYKITFNSNGGTGTMADQAIISGISTPLTTNAFTKTGSTFAGWLTTATGTTAEYADKASYTMGGSDVTLYALWTVNNIAPAIVMHPAAKSVNQGGTVSFTAEINTDVNPAPTYIRWVKNNTDTISGTTSVSLTLTGVPYTGAGNYKVIVKNSVGTAVSNNAALTVNDVTKPVLTLKGASDTTILLGSTWTDPKGTATDDKDGNITSGITPTGAPANTNSAGKFTITYNVSDAATNAATSVQRTLRIEGWESVTTISVSGFRNAILDGAENIYIASDQSIYKVSNSNAVEINTYNLAKDLTVALGSDKTSVFTYATVTGLIDKYNGSTWSNLGTYSLNSIMPSNICIGPGNEVFLSGAYPIADMHVYAMYFNGETTDAYIQGDGATPIPLTFPSGLCTSKSFCVTTNRDIFGIGENWSEETHEVVASKYTRNTDTWNLTPLEVASTQSSYMKVVNFGSTGYVGYTKGASTTSNNPVIYQSSSGSSWTKIASSVANTPAQGGGGLDIAVSAAGELHAAYVEGSNMLIKKYVNSSWVNIPDCKITASFTATGAQNPFVLPGTDVCYIVYHDGSKIYIKKWKKQ